MILSSSSGFVTIEKSLTKTQVPFDSRFLRCGRVVHVLLLGLNIDLFTDWETNSHRQK